MRRYGYQDPSLLALLNSSFVCFMTSGGRRFSEVNKASQFLTPSAHGNPLWNWLFNWRAWAWFTINRELVRIKPQFALELKILLTQHLEKGRMEILTVNTLYSNGHLWKMITVSSESSLIPKLLYQGVRSLRSHFHPMYFSL